MPLKVPNLLMSMGFCQWYIITNSNLAEFKINISGLKLIAARLKKIVVAHKQGKRVRVADLDEFEAKSEASDVGCPLSPLAERVIPPIEEVGGVLPHVLEMKEEKTGRRKKRGRRRRRKRRRRR